MQSEHYLSQICQFRCPGRLAIRTLPQHGFAEMSRQADLLLSYLILLHDASVMRIRGAFAMLCNQSDGALGSVDNPRNPVFLDVFERICNACYPYIRVPEEAIRTPAEDDHLDHLAYALRLSKVDHYSTVAEPQLARGYLGQQLLYLLQFGYPVKVGLGVVPIPFPYAVERSAVRRQLRKGLPSLAAQSFFPMPNPAELEDSIVDGTYNKRDDAIVINRDFPLYFSMFWKAYFEYLAPGHPATARPAVWRTIGAGHLGQEVADFLAERRLDQPELFAWVGGSGTAVGAANGRPLVRRWPRPLGFFNALRTDYSISRLAHYTLTPVADFQPYVLLTNYKKYVERFIIRCLYEILVNNEGGAAYLSVPDRGAVGGGLDGRIARTEAEKILPDEAEIRHIATQIEADRIVDEASDVGRAILQKVRRHFFSGDEAQMPAYHFVPDQTNGAIPRNDALSHQAYRSRIFDEKLLPGITLINIGVGPSNAKNITDHLAVLRPLCWIMVGHCGGLRNRQRLGDYVLATNYIRRDGCLETEVPADSQLHTPDVIVHAFDEAVRFSVRRQLAAGEPRQGLGFPAGLRPRHRPEYSDDLRESEEVLVLQKRMVRSGTVYTTSDRNWETAPTDEIFEEFEKYRVVAVDMESGTVAANGFRYRIPSGAFLCVSDRPLHGVIKMRYFADSFYQNQVDRHLGITLNAIRWLDGNFYDAARLLNMRELRAVNDPPWR